MIWSLYLFAFLALSAVTLAIPLLDVSLLELSVNPPTLVVGKKMDLSLSAVWAVESPMEALNGSAFLPLLAVLELLGLKIYWFPIRVGETDVTAELGLPQLALDPVAAAWMTGLMNSGYNFRVEIPLVVPVSKIPLLV